MKRYIFLLSDTPEPEQIGSKAWNLWQAHQFGYAVPPSVFLSVDAFREFIRINHLEPLIEKIQKTIEQEEDPSAWELRVKEIQQHFFTDAFPEGVVEALNEGLQQLHLRRGDTLAVRSSGVKEDAVDHSFAGQFETVLNVPPNSLDVSQAVRKVWASEWNWHNILYHKQKRLPLTRIGMGVIVQRMVKPDFAGVAFTINPAGAQVNEIVVEYVKGIGEKLVSGKVNPQRIVFHRRSFRCLSATPPDYPGELNVLPELIMGLENHYRTHVDVEWAFEKGKLYLLQVRPVTAVVHAPKSFLWTDENVGEVIPDVVTPLTWSILKPITNQAFQFFLRKNGVVSDPDLILFETFNGKVYFNRTLFDETLQKFYLGTLFKAWRERPTSVGQKLSGLIRFIGRTLRFLIRFGYFVLWLPRAIRRTERKFYRHWYREIRCSPLSRIADHFQKVETIVNYHQKVMALHVSATILGELYYQLLDKLCRHWVQTDPPIQADQLLSGLDAAESARSGIALWRLALRMVQYPDVVELFLRHEADQLEEALNRTTNGVYVLQWIEEYLEAFGHGSMNEFELLYPRWWENKAYIFFNLKRFLQTIDEYDFLREKEKLKRQRAATIHRADRAFQPPLRWAKRWVFRHVLKKAEFFSTERENLKQILVRQHGELKKHLLIIADDLVKRNMIAQVEDIFFLKIHEINQLLQRGRLSMGTPHQLIRERRNERRMYLQMSHPKKIEQIGKDWYPIAESHQDAPGLFQGIGCSNGVVEGTVRVIRSPSEFSTLRRGDILVTRSTNPGWTPLFILAAAVVTEIGGALSHGAIIAREYGIPMVAGIPDITRKLKTGDRVRVNGTRGTVEVLTFRGEAVNA